MRLRQIVAGCGKSTSRPPAVPSWGLAGGDFFHDFRVIRQTTWRDRVSTQHRLFHILRKGSSLDDGGKKSLLWRGSALPRSSLLRLEALASAWRSPGLGVHLLPLYAGADVCME